MKIQDTVIAVFNDEHSGSHVAPLPPKQWEFRGKNVTPNRLQRLLYDQYIEYAEAVGKARKGKRLVVVKLGDAVDGVHHDTKELITQYLDEQKEINKELTDRALKAMKFGKDDKMFWVAGTPAHAGESEEELAGDFKISKRNGRRVQPTLSARINGVDCLFFHHGPNKGKGANKGNALRNRLRDMYYDYRDAGKNPPQLVVTADKHAHWYEAFSRNGQVAIHGIISPAWQVKTDFVYKVVPEALANVGGVIIQITAAGEISHKFCTIEVDEERIAL